jgi:hypothetical protein
MTATGTEPAGAVGRTRLTGESSSLLQLRSTMLRLCVLVATVAAVAFTWDRDPVRAIGTALVGWLLDARGQIMLRGALPHLEVGPTFVFQSPSRSWTIPASEFVASSWMRRSAGTDRWDWTILLHTDQRTVDLRVRSGASTIDAPWLDAEQLEPVLGPFLAPELSRLSATRLSDPAGDGLTALVGALAESARSGVSANLGAGARIIGGSRALIWRDRGVDQPLTNPRFGRRTGPNAEMTVSWDNGSGVHFPAPGVAALPSGPGGTTPVSAVVGATLLHALGWVGTGTSGGPEGEDVLDLPPRGAEPHDQAPVRS